MRTDGHGHDRKGDGKRAHGERRTAEAYGLDAVTVDDPAARDGAQGYSEIADGNVERGRESPCGDGKDRLQADWIRQASELPDWMPY